MTDVVGRLSALKNVTGLMEEREILGTKRAHWLQSAIDLMEV